MKICGLTRVEDVRVAAAAGADLVGAILSPGFSRSIPAERAAGFGSARPGGATGGGAPRLVAVLVDPGREAAAAAARTAGAGILQFHGDEPPSLLATLRGEGDWRIWKALQVRSADDVERAIDRYAAVADGLLLDGWHGGRGGGAGVRFPWDVVAPVREAFPEGLAFIAAGGLEPGNVAEAVARLSPDVVDVSSGVEVRTGEKDHGRIRAFVRNARGASSGGPSGGGRGA